MYFVGFVTCENRDNRDENDQREIPLAVAKDALVFMAVGDDFKIPVAYFLLAGLRSDERSALTKLVIEKINNTGARVTSLTMDGLKANIAVAKKLGADFENDKPFFFPNPENRTDKVYTIWDPPHMMKLARGCFGDHQLYYENTPLKWNLIVELHEMQKKRNLNLGNKLTDLHINFHQNPMNVRVAAETMSLSIADNLDQLDQDKYVQFINCERTSEYIRIINNSFDISNSKPKTSKKDYKYKKPISNTNSEEVFAYFKFAKQYFKALEIDVWNREKTTVKRMKAMNSQSSTPFFGIYHNMIAMEGLYNDFVLNGPLTELFTFRFSQDHLETWFSAVRSRLGMFYSYPCVEVGTLTMFANNTMSYN